MATIGEFIETGQLFMNDAIEFERVKSVTEMLKLCNLLGIVFLGLFNPFKGCLRVVLFWNEA